MWLELAALNGRVEMTVRDDGAGFDTRQIASKAHGLLGMRFRVEAELGSLELISKPGEGTLVRAQLPESLSLTQAG